MGRSVAVEVGSMYTDVVVRDGDGAVATHKVATAAGPPVAQIEGALAAASVDLSSADTLVQNAIDVRDSIRSPADARVGLLTTRGFRDTLEIMRTNRPHPFDLQRDKPVPLVPRALRREIDERVGADGTVLVPVKTDEVVAAVRDLVESGCRSIAICFLLACAEPANERAARVALAEAFPELPVTISSDLTRDLGEFERTSTTVVNAIAMPIVERELAVVDRALRERGFAGDLLFMQANGGATTARGATAMPARTVATKGVGGVIAAKVLGALTGEGRLLAVDIGALSAVATVIERGGAAQTTSRELEGWPIMLPAVDQHDLGVGGETVAWADEVGFLQVGQRGSSDGPLGQTEPAPTVTDAFVALGALAGSAADGTDLDLRQARRSVERLARDLDASVPDVAAGIIRIANARLAAALRDTAMSRGYHPRDLTLLAHGGGGGLHAGALARELDLPRAIIPVHAPVFCALGMTAAQLTFDFSRSVLKNVLEVDPDALQGAVTECEEACREEALAAGVAGVDSEGAVDAELRYQGQRHVLKVALPRVPRGPEDLARLAHEFAREHQHFYGYTVDADVVLDTIRVRLDIPGAEVLLRRANAGVYEPPANRRRGRTPTRKVQLAPERRPTQWPVYERAALTPGATVNGPAIVVESHATTLVDEDDAVEVDAFGNLILYVDRRF